jgi:hypothetical protein
VGPAIAVLVHIDAARLIDPSWQRLSLALYALITIRSKPVWSLARSAEVYPFPSINTVAPNEVIALACWVTGICPIIPPSPDRRAPDLSMAKNDQLHDPQVDHLIGFLRLPIQVDASGSAYRQAVLPFDVGLRLLRRTRRGASRNVIVLICPSVLGTASGQIPAPCGLRSFCFV